MSWVFFFLFWPKKTHSLVGNMNVKGTKNKIKVTRQTAVRAVRVIVFSDDVPPMPLVRSCPVVLVPGLAVPSPGSHCRGPCVLLVHTVISVWHVLQELPKGTWEAHS